MLAPALGADKIGQVLAYVAVTKHLVENGRAFRHHIGNVGWRKTNSGAEGGGEGVAGVEERVLLEGRREHTNEVETHDPEPASATSTRKLLLETSE